MTLNITLEYDPAIVDQTLSETDTMMSEHYMAVGVSAIQCVNLALQAAGSPVVNRILDIPCGHGRVLRHLKARFPDAHIDASDLDADGVAFCASQFGVNPILSTPELTQGNLPGNYDLIWVGSLLTHVGRPTFQRWMAYLTSNLSPTGVAVFSMHGRYSAVLNETFPYIARDIWDGVIQPMFETTGYGYADYVEGDVGLHGVIEADYGISLAKPEIIIADAAAVPDSRIVLYSERGWIGHHDVIALAKPGYAV
ncbi:MAG: class I SAM-dependent methyltransferase [Alphaproteobacteria bacterium]|nr:class I SAM-dependent methyltransferase [Alphaproteobacteria bacterium]